MNRDEGDHEMVFCAHPFRTGRFWIVLFLCTVLLGVGCAEAAYFVRPGGTGDGATWESANGDLQAVLDQAAAGFAKNHVPVDVHVAAGTYTSPTTFVLPRGVRLWGGYPTGLTGTSVTGRDWRANATELDGEGVRRVIESVGTGATSGDTVLDGFTVTRGTAENGGGMLLWNSSPAFSNCTFSSNSGKFGGGMYLYENGSATLTNCTFMGNGSERSGGGMYVESSRATLANCTLSGNTAQRGGGMVLFRSSSTLVNTILWGNEAAEGTELYVLNTGPIAQPVLRNCVLPLGGLVLDVPDEVGVDSAGLLHGDPKLVPCDRSGAVSPDVVSVDVGFYVLGPGSSALGRGLPVGIHTVGLPGNERLVGVPADDQRGRARPSDGPTDIGACQSDTTPSPGAEPPAP